MKSGFVSIIGKPNTGKSTFINKLLGEKVSIVSPKKQTTRTTIYGILNSEESQIVFIDTPGVHKAENSLGTAMNKLAIKSSKDADVILFFVEIDDELDSMNEKIIKSFKDREAKVFLILTKTDAKMHVDIINAIDYWKDKFKFDEIIPISTFKGDNVESLITTINNNLEEGPMYYDPTQKTNKGIKFQMAEIIREKALYLLRQEVPHSVGVEIFKFDDSGATAKIFANILVEKDSQKGIVIGNQGQMLKNIGTQSRMNIQNILKKKVNLQLHVKVQENWRRDEKYFNRVGVGDEQ